jgi:bacillopeptidase F
MNANRLRFLFIRFIYHFLAILLLSGSANFLHAGVKTPELEIALQAARPEDEIRAIVRFTRKADVESLRHLPRPQRRSLMVREMKETAEKAQLEVKSLLRKRGVEDTKRLWLINGISLKARPALIQELEGHPDVESVRVDRVIRKEEILVQSFAAPEPNITQVGVPGVWLPGGYYGQGAVVGLMDTGVDVNHPDLAGRWRGGTNSWFDPFGVHLQPFDPDGHGTAVLGIMVGGDSGGTTIGTAPAAKWIAGKMFDDSGNTYLSVIHQVFQWFLDPDGNPATDDAPDVVNGSWGFETLPDMCEDEFQADIDALNAFGIAVVFASGNVSPTQQKPATSISPANNAGAVAVGFVDANSVVSPLSSRGPSTCDGRVYPDVVAPGINIKTADLSFGGAPYYVVGTGSSFSAPHASGVIALLRSAFPAASPDQLKAALIGSAADLGAAGADNIYGNGLVDALAAFNSLQAMPQASCARPDIDFDAAPYPASANQPVTFSSAVSGGTPPYTYAWDYNGDGVPDPDCDNLAACTHVYANPYAGSVGLTVTDANRCSSTLFIANGWAACTPISVGFTVSPAAPVASRAVTYTSSITGGNAPFSYEWDLDADGIVDCTTANCTKTYSTTFNGNVTLKVTDRYGCQADLYAATVTVAAAPSSSGGGGGGGCFIITALDYFPPEGTTSAFIILALAALGWRAARKQRQRSIFSYQIVALTENPKGGTCQTSLQRKIVSLAKAAVLRCRVRN